MEPGVFRDLVVDLGMPARTHSKGDTRDCERAAQVLGTHTWNKFRSLVKGDEPTLVCYLADGWGSQIRNRSVRGPHSVVRHGKSRREFLLHRAYVKRLDREGNWTYHIVPGAPVALTAGTTTWHCFSAYADWMPCPRLCWNTGVLINCWVFDGLIYSSMERLLLARADLMYADNDNFYGKDHVTLEATQWDMGVRCIAHANSLALKWGLGQYVGGRQHRRHHDRHLELDEWQDWHSRMGRAVCPAPSRFHPGSVGLGR